MALSEMLLKSRPCKVIFAGWESTTSRLQSAGWQLAMEHSWHHDRVRLAMQYRDGGMQMIAEADYHMISMHVDAARHCYGGDLRDGLPVFVVRHVANAIHVRVVDMDSFSFSPIDARMQMRTMDREIRPMDEFEIFATPLVKAQEIIVDPNSVAELMDQIKQLQAPELAMIRERQRRTERGEPIQQTRYHAQIISLAE